ELALDLLAGRDEAPRDADDLPVDLLGDVLDAAIGAVEEVDPERDRADVEMLHLDHAQRLEDLAVAERDQALDPVHRAEDALVLHDDLVVAVLRERLEGALEAGEVDRDAPDVHDEDRREVVRDDALRDV